jgi:hypothetical protein
MHAPECWCVDCEDRRHAAALWCRLVTTWEANAEDALDADGPFGALRLLGKIAPLLDEWEGMGGRTKELQADLERAEEQR